MPIITKNEQLPPQPVIILLIGDPGTAKTSLSNTCKNPLNIDFDRGFKRSYGRPDTLQITTGWAEVLHELSAGTMDKYDTIVIDTAKGCLDDFLMVYVGEVDYKLKTNKLKAYGAIGDEFKLFVNNLRAKGKDIFIIAHSKADGEGDKKRIVADITGQSNALILRISDQVGYLSIQNKQRIISFNPSDETVGKNVAGLPDLTLPIHTSNEWIGYGDREIIQKVKDSLAAMSEEQRSSLEFIDRWRSAIDAISPELGKNDVTAAELYETLAGEQGIAKIPEEHLKKQVRLYFQAHLKKIGWKWVDADKSFKPTVASEVPPVTDSKPAEQKAPEPPPVVVNEAEKPTDQSESNPSALLKNEVLPVPPIGPDATDGIDYQPSAETDNLFGNMED